MPPDATAEGVEAAAPRLPCSQLFLVFSGLSLQGFGGVLPFAYRALVERHRWLTPAQFAEHLGICQLLPGPTICNIALMVGHRYAGARGGLAAIAGLVGGPFLIVIALGVLYQRFGELEVFRSALRGMTAVAAGLILATGIKMAIAAFRESRGRHRRSAAQLVLAVLAFCGLGVLQWPLIVVVFVLAPLGTVVFLWLQKQMDDGSPVVALCAHLALLSLMAVGGGLVMIAPEVRAYVVDAKHWLHDEQFAAAYAIAQAAPGPNLLFISLIGWFVAGWTGAIAATLAVIVPPTVLTLALLRTPILRTEHPFARALRDAFLPMAIGLLVAVAWIFMGALNGSWRADVLTLICALIVVRTRFNPVLLIAAGAMLGAAHIV